MIKLEKILKNSFVAAVEHYGTIDSTNDRALAAAAEPNVRLPLLIVADAQTAGRGRGSNRWWTGPGSLAFSLLLPAGARSTGFSRNGNGAEPSPFQERGRLKPVLHAASRPSVLVSLAVGVALVDALAPLVSGHEIGIYWPNDVMLDGRKLAGVLIEVLPDGRQVIGVGINTNNTAADAPAEVRSRVATLRDATGRTYDPTELLMLLLNRLEQRLGELALAPEGIVARTNELCPQRGTIVQVRQGEALIVGTCQGIACDGAMLLQTADRTQCVYSGTVVPERTDL